MKPSSAGISISPSGSREHREHLLIQCERRLDQRRPPGRLLWHPPAGPPGRRPRPLPGQRPHGHDSSFQVEGRGRHHRQEPSEPQEPLRGTRRLGRLERRELDPDGPGSPPGGRDDSADPAGRQHSGRSRAGCGVHGPLKETPAQPPEVRQPIQSTRADRADFSFSRFPFSPLRAASTIPGMRSAPLRYHC